MLHTRALLLLLAACVSAALSAAEIPLSHPVQGPAAGVQYGPLVASDGDGYFVVWSDGRDGYQIRGTRVSREGQVLDGTGILLFSNTYGGIPYVTWTGTSYLVLWGRHDGYEILGLRMDRDGNIIDGPRVVASPATILGLASNGTNLALLYWNRESNETRARILTPDAAPVTDFFIREGIHGIARLAAAGSQFAVFWTENFGWNEPVHISAIRFTAAQSLDAEPRLLVYDERQIMSSALASDGTSYLLLTGNSGSERTHARRISADLSTVGDPHLLPQGINSSFSSVPSLLWTGTSYKVISTAGHNVLGTELDRDGQPGEVRTIEAETNGRTSPTPAAETNGSDLLIAWIGATDPAAPSAGFGSVLDVYATIADESSLEPRGRALVSISAPSEYWPRVASSGANLLAVWVEGTFTYARRLHPDGSWADAEPLRLGKPVLPYVIYNGAEYLVAWFDSDANALITKRIPKDGALRAEAGAAIGVPYGQDLALAVADNITFLAWTDLEGVKAVRLDRQAALLDHDPVLVTEDPVEHIAASSDGSGRFLVVWSVTEERIGSPPITVPVAIRGTRFDTNLTRLDGGLVIADSPANEGEPAVTWNGSRWLVLWTRNDREIRGRHVAADGTLADGVVTDDGVLVAAEATDSHVTWDGSRYLAAWTTTGVRGRLQAAWLPRLGETTLVRELGERTWFPDTDVALAPVRPGAVAAVYTRVAREPQYGSVSRAFATVLEMPVGRRRSVR